MAKLTILEALNAVKSAERVLKHELSEEDMTAVVRLAEEEKARYGVQSKVKGSQSEVSLMGDNGSWEAFSEHFQKRAQASGLDVRGRSYLELMEFIQSKKKLS